MPSRVGVPIHVGNCFRYFFGCAPKVRPSRSYRKNLWNLLIFKVGTDARATEAAQETCRKLARKSAFPKREKYYLYKLFLLFGLAAPRFKKMLPKWPPKPSRRASRAVLGTPREPKIDQLFASGRPRGAPSHFLGPGGPRSLQDAPGGSGGGS